MSTLSIIVPAYNEAKTIEELLKKVLQVKLPSDYKKEVIVINDCSKDATADIVKKLSQKFPEITFLNNEKNMGKTQTVRKGILHSTGEYVVIQDADLEYDPNDFVEMLRIAIAKDYDVVYGDRFGKENKVIYKRNYWGNKALSAFSNFFTYSRIQTWIPDMETCYKMCRGEIIRKIAENIEAKTNFGLEPELTAKLSLYKRKGKNLRFAIYPISYYPRTIAEGKKIRFTDGFHALKEIVLFNLFPGN